MVARSLRIGYSGTTFDSVALALGVSVELPRTVPSMTYNGPTTYSSGQVGVSGLQAAYNSANLGDAVYVDPASSGSLNFTLSAKSTGSGYLYVVSAGIASLPAAGSRIRTTDTGAMPTITGTGAGTSILALSTSGAANDVWIVGMVFKAPSSGGFTSSGLCRLGTFSETSLAQHPRRIVLDRCIIVGDSTLGLRRALTMNGIDCMFINCIAYQCFESGAESHGILTTQGGGNRIHNNRIEAAGINIMFGGADPTISGHVPYDMTITQNHLKKDTAWIGAGLGKKNNFESKNLIRCLFEGNQIENSWEDAQDFASNTKSANQDGTAPQSGTYHLTNRYNYYKNVCSGIGLVGTDDGNSGPTSNVSVHNNVVQMTGLGSGATQRGLQMLGNLTNLVFARNSIVAVGSAAPNNSYIDKSTAPPMSGVTVTGNIFPLGFTGPGGSGKTALTSQGSSMTETNNAFVGSSQTFDATSSKPANNAAIFTDAANGNFTSTDATKGADWSTVSTKAAAAVAG